MARTTRREFLKSSLAAGAACALGRPTSALGPTEPANPGAFRFVHLTDIHVQRERGGDRGFAKALRAVEALKPRPDFVLTGGDLVFDVLDTDAAKARELFTLYKKVIADNTSLPVFNTIGNHDVLGWGKKSGLSPAAAGYGKALAQDFLHLPRTYYHFDHKGWRFFCLDNIQPGGNERYPYEGRLDPQQTDWLKTELAATDPKTPIITCEHIPPVTVTGFSHDELFAEDEWRFRSAFICGDASARLKLLATRNVRLALSGHIHERDRIDYRNITFINDGAVCGSWWKGPHRGVEEGFGVLDCLPNGTFDYQYLDYGWDAQP